MTYTFLIAYFMKTILNVTLIFLNVIYIEGYCMDTLYYRLYYLEYPLRLPYFKIQKLIINISTYKFVIINGHII